MVLTGVGTAGAYHAGVLRALHETGVKIDVVAGHGVGVVGALFAAIDGGQSLWGERGFWRAPGVRTLYPWRRSIRIVARALLVSAGIVVLPLAAMALGLVVFPLDFLSKMVGSGAGGLAERYVQITQAAFAPDVLPTWLPRLVFLVLGFAGAIACAAGWLDRPRGRARGPLWWRAVGAPMSSRPAYEHCWRTMWDLVRGATQLEQPPVKELGRRYSELLAENIGQPGFSELLIVVHDLDAHRDLVFAHVSEARRQQLVRRPLAAAADERRAEVFDLCGVAREHLIDAVAAALAVPVATDAHLVTFAPDAYWRGETHRVCDRPASLSRTLDELIGLGVEQIVMVSAAPQTPGPHALAAPRLEGRARLGEYLQSTEAALVRDLSKLLERSSARVFTIRPTHNPVGPFDFSGGFDDRSDRRQPLEELMASGYEDAYRQFIEPVVGGSGERVGIEA